MIVLIVANRSDPHTRAVQDELARRGIEAALLDSEFGSSTSKTVVRFGENVSEGEIILIDGIPTPSFTGIYYRPKPSFSHVDRQLDEIQKQFIDKEWAHALDAVCESLENRVWVNTRSANRRAGNKIRQLQLASRHGFSIPRTVVTNCQMEASAFLADIGGMGIFKVLTFFFRPPDKITFTSHITTSQLASLAASLQLSPGIFQEEVPKAYELRITVVGNAAFPAAIHSQQTRAGSLDWRRAIEEVEYSRGVLPPRFLESLLAFHESLGLIYGAYDFIVTPSGEYYFLEVNPTGNYLWIEERLGYPITHAICEFFASSQDA